MQSLNQELKYFPNSILTTRNDHVYYGSSSVAIRYVVLGRSRHLTRHLKDEKVLYFDIRADLIHYPCQGSQSIGQKTKGFYILILELT